jgi:hypothetical protein
MGTAFLPHDANWHAFVPGRCDLPGLAVQKSGETPSWQIRARSKTFGRWPLFRQIALRTVPVHANGLKNTGTLHTRRWLHFDSATVIDRPDGFCANCATQSHLAWLAAPPVARVLSRRPKTRLSTALRAVA